MGRSRGLRKAHGESVVAIHFAKVGMIHPKGACHSRRDSVLRSSGRVVPQESRCPARILWQGVTTDFLLGIGSGSSESRCDSLAN